MDENSIAQKKMLVISLTNKLLKVTMKKFIYFLFLFSFFARTFVFSEEISKDKNKKVFLSGAAGFIGSNFLKYMFDKYPDYDFVVLDALTYAGNLENIPSYIKESPRYQFMHGSVVDYPLVDSIMSSSNYVVHFAAESHVTRSILDDYVFFNTEVLGTRAMLASLVSNVKTVERFIHISTSEVYGTADYQPMDELHPLKPRSPYAAAKAAADRLVFAYACTYDVPALIIRPFNNYGPNQHLEKLVPHLIASAIRDEPLTIHGDGSQSRDWLHVSDTCVALDKALHLAGFEKMKNQEINIGTGIAISVLEIAKMILKEFNLPESYLNYVQDRPGQVDIHIAGISKAKSLLDWEPSIKIEEGLKKTIEWYKNNQNLWSKLELEEVVNTDIVHVK